MEFMPAQATSLCRFFAHAIDKSRLILLKYTHLK